MMAKIGRPAVGGPRLTFNVTDMQATALDQLAGENRSEWIRDAIEQRIQREALPVDLLLAQDRDDHDGGILLDALVIAGGGSDDDLSSEVVLLDDGTERWDAIVDVEPSEEKAPYDEALEAAGWVIVSETPHGEQWVVRADSTIRDGGEK